MTGIFDIENEKELFQSIKRRYGIYLSGKTRSTEDLLYVIMALNHLREWIAPGYDHEDPADNEAKIFYKEIFGMERIPNCKQTSERH